MTTRHAQSGVAVITALLIVALATTISAGIATSLQLEVRRTGNLVSGDQALQYIKPAERLAMNVLSDDAENNDTDHLAEGWALDIPPFPVDGGQVSGKITDLHRCFNVNNVDPGIAAGLSASPPPADTPADSPIAANKTAVDRFRLLLRLPEVDIDPSASDALLDWIDADSNITFPGGGEDGHYLNLERPYRAANQTLKSITSLRLVKGFEDPKKFAALLPFVCALDAATPINVNTAPVEVLLSLDENVERADIEEVIALRENSPFDQVNDFLKVGNLTQTITDTAGLSVSSDYFLLTSRIEIGNASKTVFSVLFRNQGAETNVLYRMQNTL